MIPFRLFLIRLLLSLLGFMPFSLSAQQSITIYSPAITSLIEPDGSGVYQQIINSAINNLQDGFSVTQSFLPYKRAIKSFQSSPDSCIYSLTNTMIKTFGEDNIISSYPLGSFRFYFFTRKNEDVITKISQLSGKQVGGIRGHETFYPNRLNNEVNIYFVNSDEQNFQMLKKGRIDVMIGVLPDVNAYLQHLSYDPNQPFNVGYDRITCHRTDANEKFLKALNPVLQKMHTSGVYKQQMGDIFMPF